MSSDGILFEKQHLFQSPLSAPFLYIRFIMSKIGNQLSMSMDGRTFIIKVIVLKEFAC